MAFCGLLEPSCKRKIVSNPPYKRPECPITKAMRECPRKDTCCFLCPPDSPFPCIKPSCPLTCLKFCAPPACPLEGLICNPLAPSSPASADQSSNKNSSSPPSDSCCPPPCDPCCPPPCDPCCPPPCDPCCPPKRPPPCSLPICPSPCDPIPCLPPCDPCCPSPCDPCCPSPCDPCYPPPCNPCCPVPCPPPCDPCCPAPGNPCCPSPCDSCCPPPCSLPICPPPCDPWCPPPCPPPSADSQCPPPSDPCCPPPCPPPSGDSCCPIPTAPLCPLAPNACTPVCPPCMSMCPPSYCYTVNCIPACNPCSPCPSCNPCSPCPPCNPCKPYPPCFSYCVVPCLPKICPIPPPPCPLMPNVCPLQPKRNPPPPPPCPIKTCPCNPNKKDIPQNPPEEQKNVTTKGVKEDGMENQTDSCNHLEFVKNKILGNKKKEMLPVPKVSPAPVRCPFEPVPIMCHECCPCDNVAPLNTGPECPFRPPDPICPPVCPQAKIPVCPLNPKPACKQGPPCPCNTPDPNKAIFPPPDPPPKIPDCPKAICPSFKPPCCQNPCCTICCLPTCPPPCPPACPPLCPPACLPPCPPACPSPCPSPCPPPCPSTCPAPCCPPCLPLCPPCFVCPFPCPPVQKCSFCPSPCDPENKPQTEEFHFPDCPSAPKSCEVQTEIAKKNVENPRNKNKSDTKSVVQNPSTPVFSSSGSPKGITLQEPQVIVTSKSSPSNTSNTLKPKKRTNAEEDCSSDIDITAQKSQVEAQSTIKNPNHPPDCDPCPPKRKQNCPDYPPRCPILAKQCAEELAARDPKLSCNNKPKSPRRGPCCMFPCGRDPDDDLNLCSCEYPMPPCMAPDICAGVEPPKQYCFRPDCCMGLPPPPMKEDEILSPPVQFKLKELNPGKEGTKYFIDIINLQPKITNQPYPHRANWFIHKGGKGFEACRTVAEIIRLRGPSKDQEVQYDKEDCPLSPMAKLILASKNRNKKNCKDKNSF